MYTYLFVNVISILAKNFDAAGEHSKYWLPPLLQTNKPLRFVTPPPPLPKNIIEEHFQSNKDSINDMYKSSFTTIRIFLS